MFYDIDSINLISWILLGGVAGLLASFITGGLEDRGGCLFNILIGILGAFVGGFLFRLIGGVSVTGFNLYSIIVSTIGAIIVIAILKAIRK